jgi:DMSO/TMAO reductase YedYZ heme-binding membrane subunit
MGKAMEAVYYTITGVVLYLLADRILRVIEARAGRIFEHRTLIFFVLLLSMALVSFAVIRRLLPPAIDN